MALRGTASLEHVRAAAVARAAVVARVAVVAVVVAMLLGSGAVSPGYAQEPQPSTPSTGGAVDESDWLPGSPAEADSAAADSVAADSLRRAGVLPEGRRLEQNLGAPPPQEQPLPQAATPAGSSAAIGSPGRDRSIHMPPNSGTGVSFGYPSYPGLFLVMPADGPFAFRTGFTGFPTVGLLWTPGLEYRFGQERGTLSENGLYAFGNAFLGRTYVDDEKDYAGAEAGLGVRWLVDDRRGVRWIAAVEGGGYWRGDPATPRRLSLRFIWMLVE